MAYERETVQIVNPDNHDDYIVIAKDDFDPKEHRLFRSGQPAPLEGAKEPEAYQFADVLKSALDVTVARLGPWLAEQSDVELLVRLLDLEPRKSAKRLIEDRLAAIRNQD